MSKKNQHFQRVLSGSLTRRKPARRSQHTLALEALEPKKLLSASQPMEYVPMDASAEAYQVVPAVFAQQQSTDYVLGNCFVEQVASQIRAAAPTVPIEIVPLNLVSSLPAKPGLATAGLSNRVLFARQDPPPGGGGGNQGPVAPPVPNAPGQESLIKIEWGDEHVDADGKRWRDGKIVEETTTNPPVKKEIGTVHEETTADKDAKGKPTGTTTTTTTEKYDSGKTKVTEVVKDKKGNVVKTTTTERDTDANGNETVKQTVQETDKNGKKKTTTTEHGTDKDGKKTVKQTVEETDKKGKTTTTNTEWKQESNGKWYKKDGDKWVEDKTGPPAPPKK